MERRDQLGDYIFPLSKVTEVARSTSSRTSQFSEFIDLGEKLSEDKMWLVVPNHADFFANALGLGPKARNELSLGKAVIDPRLGKEIRRLVNERNRLSQDQIR